MAIRLNKVIKEFNVGLQTVVDFLEKKGQKLEEVNPNTKLTDEQYSLVKKEFQTDEHLRNEAEKLRQSRQEEKRQEQLKKEKAKEERKKAVEIKTEIPQVGPKVVGKIDLEQKAATLAELPQKEAPKGEKPVKKKKPEAAPAPKAEQPQSKAEQPEQKLAEAPAVPAPKVEEKAESQKKQKASVEERAREIGQVKDGVFELKSTPELQAPKVLGTIDLAAINASTRPKKKTKEERRKERENKQQTANGEKKKRNRIGGGQRVDINAAANQQGGGGNRNRNNNNNAKNNSNNQGAGKKNNRRAKAPVKQEVSDEDVAKQVRDTLARLTNKSKASKGAKYRKEKREQVRAQEEELRREEKAESKVLKLTEFVTANELATMMDVPVTKVIGTCMNIGMMVSINQRLEAETIDIVAEEFGFKTEYVSAEVQDAVAEVEDAEEDLKPRAPIVTVMGHVDHGKTSLLDYVRNANVIAGEAGGITQHVGAYNVTLESGRNITFLDTPGHEAFTAMRARGAQVTDIAIIIIAADDDIMPQTKEAINHAVAANVPIVFAINKIDKPTANPDKIKESLAAMNFLVEEWGGKYQSQDISAKKGLGVKELLEKVLLEADMLELKANPHRNATGTIIESTLDKGRGYTATVLVSNGTLHQGDVVLAGTSFGRVKALFNERGQRIQEVGPAMSATLLGFNGAPQAGDQFHVMSSEQEAREITTKREQLQREQDLRTQKMLTLDEIGRRLKQGDYQELNIIVKGDVDGSVEALSDSFIKLSTPTIQVNVIHKSVGQISENDVTLAAASQAVIVGFQVRPSQAARKLADKEGVEIRQYSVIYDAIDDVCQAMEGMLKPIVKEQVTATIDVRQVYHISKVGIVAGAYVSDGKVKRTDKARLIRDGIVVFTGAINALKRFKDDVKEVSTNFECGISLANCNDIKEGDIIETYEEIEIKQKLK
ncbi:translation initiation factor IF-2 [Alloprevotella rava]|uniref:Translation initiation factor IF-2 n=1 Tax=Alloprevotella rava TaxID=671218 RepID=A0A7W5UMK9_9BACT|nr:translation initiation factor IF-2 [Alloprevotella rava]MBB3702777.1 translation initiation factor IF-2 [Alloprevotella rava]